MSELAEERVGEPNASIMSRIEAFLIESPAQQRARNAGEALRNIQKKTDSMVPVWTRRQAARLLRKAPADASTHRELTRQFKAAADRYNSMKSTATMVQKVRDLLKEARSACDSALNYEMLDVFTTNKTVSLMSMDSTQTAGNAIRTAAHAMKNLPTSIARTQGKDGIREPDDLLDTIVDLCASPAFDFLSLVNMSSLERATAACDKASEKLKENHRLLIERVSIEKRMLDRQATQLKRLHAPYLEKAYARLPDELRRESGPLKYEQPIFDIEQDPEPDPVSDDYPGSPAS